MKKLNNMDPASYCENFEADSMEYDDSSSSVTSTPFVNSPAVNHHKIVDFPPECLVEEEEDYFENTSSSQKRTVYSYGSDGRIMKVATRKTETNNSDKFSRKKSFSRYPSWCVSPSFTITQPQQNQSSGRGLKRNSQSQSCIIKTDEQNQKRQRVETITETIDRYSSLGLISSTSCTDTSQESNFTSLYHEDFEVSSQAVDD